MRTPTFTDDGQCEDAIDRSIEGKNTLDEIGQGGANGVPGDQNEECIDVVVDFEPIIPNVVLLIDRSGSMNASNFGDSVDAAIAAGTYEAWDCGADYNWRWNVVRNILLHPENGVVKPLENDVRFGLSLYSSNGGFSGGTCPMLTTVDIDFGTHAEMLETFQCSDYLVDTPTRESLRDTANALADLDLDGKDVIVLATDGEPDNCTCNNWNGGDCDGAAATAEQAAVVAEAERIHDDLGIVTHVIDVSRPDNTSLHEHLSDVADGGGGDIFDGTNPAGLADAFQTIIDGARSCAIDLDGEIESGKESTGTVTLNGDKLTLNGDNGWIVNSPTQIELVGDACETIKSGSQNLDISFPCGSFNVPGIK